MILLTLVEESEEIFVNPSKIVAIVANDEGTTDVMCDQLLFVVKETPLQVNNLIAKCFN